MLSFFSFFFLLTCPLSFSFFFFFNDTATTEIYTLSLHDALPISLPLRRRLYTLADRASSGSQRDGVRSEEHTSELQSRLHLVCRLLLEKKKKKKNIIQTINNKTTSKVCYNKDASTNLGSI